ncbi:hypothetical protein MXD62_08610, partial [Frankia sp. Mgl5]|uniref:FliH/SctL family protein n=1 Tax=Frankia sp. Mgl5 TaxID=2933793 RepID=UPI00200F6668
ADMQEKGKQAGVQQGIEEGKAMALEEENDKIQTARDVLSTAYLEKDRIVAEAEPFLVELSIEIAKKVIGDELVSSPEKILEIVRRALRRSRV